MSFEFEYAATIRPECVKLAMIHRIVVIPEFKVSCFLLPILFLTDLTMAFTALEIHAFFEDADYLGLSHRTAQASALEGITTPANLADFDKDGSEQIYRNLRKPAKVLQGGAVAPGGAR